MGRPGFLAATVPRPGPPGDAHPRPLLCGDCAPSCVKSRSSSARFVVLDVHSYNHRRDGPDAPAASAELMPQVNIGTFSMDRRRWAHVVDPFMERLRAFEFRGRPMDVRENVAFQGRGEQTRFIHHAFPATGCAIAIEFKKFFMDEWTGEADPEALDAIRTDDPVHPAAARRNPGGIGLTATATARPKSAVPGWVGEILGLSRARRIGAPRLARRRSRAHRQAAALPLPACDRRRPVSSPRSTWRRPTLPTSSRPRFVPPRRFSMALGRAMLRKFGAFMVVEVAELEEDRLLSPDSPFLPAIRDDPDAAGPAGRTVPPPTPLRRRWRRRR